MFCLEHRLYKSHECQKPDINSRKVIVCELCSVSIETTGQFGEAEKVMMERHQKSGNCDPSTKKKPTCSVKRCKEILTFSNSATCKTCNLKVCLKHRFPADHSCKKDLVVGKNAGAVAGAGKWTDKILAAMAAWNGKECTENDRSLKAAVSPSSRNPSVKAY